MVASNSFKKIVKLIKKKRQFIELPLIQLRIKFDANMELAHLYSQIGDYSNTNKCYQLERFDQKVEHHESETGVLCI